MYVYNRRKNRRSVDVKEKLAMLYYEYGLMHKAKGEPTEAKAHLEKARTMFEEMGMGVWVEKAKSAIEEIKQNP